MHLLKTEGVVNRSIYQIFSRDMTNKSCVLFFFKKKTNVYNQFHEQVEHRMSGLWTDHFNNFRSTVGTIIMHNKNAIYQFKKKIPYDYDNGVL